jgi:hypothetical protein
LAAIEKIMKKNFFIAIAASISLLTFGQKDSLIFDGGQVIVGEVKEMNRNVLVIETDYSDSDFKIEWEKVSEFYSSQLYLVQVADRSILTNASIVMVEPQTLKVTGDFLTKEVRFEDIVYFRQIDPDFWSKLSASIDLGFSLTKASNLRQFNTSANVGFNSTQWTMKVTYRQVRSQQDDVDPIRRIDGGANADYALRNGVFFGTGLSFLSNTEQRLNLRTTGFVGSGYYFIRNNHLYWQSFLGLAINNENFEENPEEPSADRESYEGVLGTELNMYDIGDLNLFTNVTWYPSLTEDGRNRIDFRFDVSYDLPLDFYIKSGVTLNYDSDPAPGASDTDYVIVTGFGWSL